jgi:hypothetical protein
LSHHEISNFRLWIERTIKQPFSQNLKIFQHLFYYRKYSIEKIIVWFFESNKKLCMLHSC